jgi:hypothetical protein
MCVSGTAKFNASMFGVIVGCCACRAFTSAAVQEAVASKQLGLTGLRQLLLMYQQQLADVRAIPSIA